MTSKLLIGAFALVMTAGAAFAAGGDTTSALDNKDMMAPFFTDADMTTMRSDEEFKAAWMALTEEDRETVSKECSTDSEKLHNAFCEKAKELGGAN